MSQSKKDQLWEDDLLQRDIHVSPSVRRAALSMAINSKQIRNTLIALLHVIAYHDSSHTNGLPKWWNWRSFQQKHLYMGICPLLRLFRLCQFMPFKYPSFVQMYLRKSIRSGVAEWLGRRTWDRKVPDSIPGQAGISCTLGKGVLLRFPHLTHV